MWLLVISSYVSVSLSPRIAVLSFLFLLMLLRPPVSTLFPYTTLFRSHGAAISMVSTTKPFSVNACSALTSFRWASHRNDVRDRKSTRLNSSHRCISYAVFCLKKKNTQSVLMILTLGAQDWCSRTDRLS